MQPGGYGAAPDDDAQLDVLQHGVSRKIRAGDVAYASITDGSFAVDLPARVFPRLLSPVVDPRRGESLAHRADRIDGDRAAVFFTGFKQYREHHSPVDGQRECLHDGWNVVRDEADQEQGVSGTGDHFQQRLFGLSRRHQLARGPVQTNSMDSSALAAW